MHNCNKTNKMNVLEEYEMYKVFKSDQDLLLNDKLIYKNNSLFSTAINIINENSF